MEAAILQDYSLARPRSYITASSLLFKNSRRPSSTLPLSEHGHVLTMNGSCARKRPRSCTFSPLSFTTTRRPRFIQTHSGFGGCYCEKKDVCRSSVGTRIESKKVFLAGTDASFRRRRQTTTRRAFILWEVISLSAFFSPRWRTEASISNIHLKVLLK